HEQKAQSQYARGRHSTAQRYKANGAARRRRSGSHWDYILSRHAGDHRFSAVEHVEVRAAPSHKIGTEVTWLLTKSSLQFSCQLVINTWCSPKIARNLSGFVSTTP